MRDALLASAIKTEITKNSIITKVLNLLNSLAQGDEVKSVKSAVIVMIFAPHSSHFLEKYRSGEN
jgi:hypothetical protein